MLKNQGPGTVVGANVRLQGTLKDNSDIIVHGQVEGEVISDQTVTVAENASIKGPVTAKIVTLSGTIRGAVDAKEKLEIMPSGRLHGSVTTTNLIIHSGATFNGKSTMGDAKAEEKASKTNQEQDTKDSDILSDLEVEIE